MKALWLTASVIVGAACSDGHNHGTAGSVSASLASSAPAPAAKDSEFDTCLARYEAVLAQETAPGAKSYDAHRSAFLGRVRGEPVLFVREPAPSSTDGISAAAKIAKAAFDKEPPGLRLLKLKDRLKHDKPSLRALLLREGYFYADDPDDLFEMVERVSLTDLFDAPTLSLLRQGEVSHLERGGTAREPTYVFSDGKAKGQRAQLLFGDRIAERDEDLARPIHRDITALADREGFERMRVDRLTESDIAATLRFGEVSVRAVLASHGPSLELACVAEPKEARDLALAHARDTEPQRAALRALREKVGEVVLETLPFDRPRGVTGPDRDGELRPFWMGAYLAGQTSFKHDDEIYSVYHADGRPNPPEVCVDFVLDTFERTGGSWYAPRGEKPHRDKGRLSFDQLGLDRPRGVVALGKFAEALPELFEMHRMSPDERIPFQDRARFFGFLEEHASLFVPGDILSIQGLKRDDRVHQHAILLEAIDPITGFPYALADQMKAPRRRSWEGIMGEAPKRSLYFRIHPKPTLVALLAPPDTALAQTAH